MNPRRRLLVVTASGCGAGATTVECSGTDTDINHQHSGQDSTAVVSSLRSIESQISSGRMPQAAALAAAEQARVQAWLACGAP
jgi:hypothetical protein